MASREDGYVAVATDVVDDCDERGPLALERHGASTAHTPNIVKEPLGGGSFTLLPEGKGYKYAYGPGGLPGLRHNYYALASAVFASIGGLLFGYDQGVIANVLVMKDFRSRWQASPWDIGLMTAMLELGALAGALLAGTFADRYSRKVSIFSACVIFCVGSLLQCGAHSLGQLIWGRAIGGIGIGSLSMLSPLYMAEISPPEVRGSLMAMEQLAIVLGVVLGFWTGFFTRHSLSPIRLRYTLLLFKWTSHLRLPVQFQVQRHGVYLWQFKSFRGFCLLLVPSFYPRLPG